VTIAGPAGVDATVPVAPAAAPTGTPLRPRDYLAYGALRAPLALLELPLFVLLPTFYAEKLGVDLTVIGAILFFTRLVDAVADPTVGVLLDRRPAADTYRRWILWALPVLALGYCAVFTPPSGVSLPAWLAVSSVVTYLAYSVVSISYQAWGARLGDGPLERVRVTASRESFGLLGVLLSASLLLP
jgi:Na+/melibiose symporter-like transporter